VVKRLFCASGSPGINQVAKPVDIAQTDIDGLVRFAVSEGIDLTVVGPEDPLASGIVDEFEQQGLRIFGPSKAASLLEASKAFAKSVMGDAGVPTADFEVFDDAAAARDYLKNRDGPLVVKADGLALGKGVTICEDPTAALAAVTEAMEHHRFGAAGNRIVIEERLRGEELSFFALCNGIDAVSLGFVRDHKAIFDSDRGPNTGGMGAFSPVPGYDKSFEDRVIREVVEPTLKTMARRGTPFKGVLFAGLMVDGDRVSVLEFNVRFGDPECQALMMRFEGDFAEALLAVAEGRTRDAAVKLSTRSAVAVVLASGGYPGDYRKGLPISGLEKIDGVEPSEMKVQWALSKTRVKVFHAGTALRDGRLVTDGGRVLAVTAMADGLEHAVAIAYQAADMIEFDGKHLRRDVGHQTLERNVITPGVAPSSST
jgi:phosphoribosylamine--glycine ligase